MEFRSLTRVGLLGCVAALAGTSTGLAQDSVAFLPGDSDALSATGTPQRVRFVVDLVPMTSSWGNAFAIAPLLKASADPDPMFPTLLLGSASVSADVLGAQAFDPMEFAAWTTPGAGVNPLENVAPGAVSVSDFSRQFGVALSDLSAEATNAIGATVGVRDGEPGRVYVTRVVAAADRLAGGTSLSTISLGSVDASGSLALRFDNFNATASAQTVVGENLALIDLVSRSDGPQAFFGLGGVNASVDASATDIVVNAGGVTTNVPTLVPGDGPGEATVVGFDFASVASADGVPVSGHLDAGIDAHRGNPHFVALPGAGGQVGVVASLARADGASATQSVNVYSVDASGQVVGTSSATLPDSLTDGVQTVNAGGDAEFLQYLSQTGFRGPSGLVGAGLNPATGDVLVAATGADASTGVEFIAAATLGSTASWELVAYSGKGVLDGPGGSPVGTIVASQPTAFSAPGVDALGNVYFVARVAPSGGEPREALIKGVRMAGGYELERIVEEGQSFSGANSGRTYTIDSIRLADSDSLASGGFHAGQVLPGGVFGPVASEPASPFAFGGATVNASITYDNAGVPESYEAVLLIAPAGEVVPPACPADLNGDGGIDALDLGVLLGAFGSGTGGDVNDDGVTDALDLGVLLGEFGTPCP